MDFDWRDYLPLAKAKTSKFYRKQDRGRFRYEELLSEAVNALATSLGAKYAKIAIRGALLDYERDSHKIVRDVEMSEEEFLRTRGSPAAPPAAVLRTYVEGGKLVTVYSPGPYRTNAQLLAGDCKVSSKHGKVRVKLGRSSFNDEWSQAPSGWKRAKIEDDEDQDHDPRASMVLQRGEVDQGSSDVKDGRQQRFSTSCHNHGADHKFGLGESYRFDDGKVVVWNPNRKRPAPHPPNRRSAAAGHQTIRPTNVCGHEVPTKGQVARGLGG
jgi:hypothetical protein